MVDIQRLVQIKNVFFHSSCPDGTAAALIIASAFRGTGVTPGFLSLQYSTDFMTKMSPESGQLFVDITPPKERWEEWIPFSPVVLDHHETAKHVTVGLEGVYGENEFYSGANLAFEEVLMPMNDWYEGRFEQTELNKWKAFAELAMIRDTWKDNHPRWRDACAQSLALSFFGAEFLLDSIQNNYFDFEGVQKLGQSMLEVNERRTDKIVESAYRTEVSGTRVALFNCTEKLISDVANQLIRQGESIAIGYFYLFENNQQKLIASIRTNGTVSASNIAKHFGGGGHPRAAGFSIPNAESISPHQILKYIEEGLKHT